MEYFVMADTIDLQALVEELGPRVAAGAAERDEAGTFVTENYELLKAHGVFSALVPSELGGGGARHSEMCAFVRALAHHCPSTALPLAMHQHLVSAAVVNYRNGKPGQKLLERVADGQTVLISTGANDWLESSGSAEKVEGGFRITAKKPFGSGSPAGNILVTSAPYEDPEDGWQVLHFPVPFTAEGVSLANDWNTLGMRATGSHTVVLDRVFVPEEAIVLRRPRGEYHMAWNVILTVAMPLIMSAYMGVAEAAAEIARAQAAKRENDPAAPFFLGELANILTTAQLAADDMIRIANDFNFEPTIETANAILVRKTIVAKSVLATAEKALEISGGAGFFRRFALERLVRDAHGAQFHPLQEKQQQHFTGRLALGLDPIAHAKVRKVRAAA
jgi:alkylation response protein AidB-like acyl-CoA dehydrogenase